MNSMLALYIILGILLAYLIYAYNSFVSLRNQVLNSYSGIDVQLKRSNCFNQSLFLIHTK